VFMKKNYKFLITIVIIAVAIYMLVRFLNKNKNGKNIIKDVLNIPDELGCVNPSFGASLECDVLAPILDNPKVCFGDNSCAVASLQDTWNNSGGKDQFDPNGKDLTIDGKLGCKTRKAFDKVKTSTGGCWNYQELDDLMW
jgi:hypothetical protein